MIRIALAALFAPLLVATDIGPEIRTSDVDRFYTLYDATGGKPSEAQIQRDYLDGATDGFAAFMAMRRITATSIAARIAAQPDLYVRARGWWNLWANCAPFIPRRRCPP